jgi:hypothetical protein
MGFHVAVKIQLNYQEVLKLYRKTNIKYIINAHTHTHTTTEHKL